MTAYKCDRCGKFYSQEDHENMLGNMENNGLKCPCIINASGIEQLRYENKLDLCPVCTMTLTNWLLTGEGEE